MTISEICVKAEEIAQKYNPQGLSPFPYENLQIEKKDFDIYTVKLEPELSGGISYSKETERYSIIINMDKAKTRQNFTIAHELGHYFLHQDIIKSEVVLVDGDGFLDSSNTLYRLDNAAQNILETEANNFAASLLMPTQLVLRAWNSMKSIEELSSLFNVSPVAMSIRLERLGLNR